MQFAFVPSFALHPDLNDYVQTFQHGSVVIRYHFQRDKLTIEGTIFDWNWNKSFKCAVRALQIHLEQQKKK